MDVLNDVFVNGKARELLAGGEVSWEKGPLTLRPYQALWLSNH